MADKRLRIYGHDDAPPPTNGKRWWRETWGKAIGSVLGALMLGALYWAGGRALAFKASTAEVYSLPPRVEKLEAWKASLPAPQPALPADVVKDLRDFLEAQKAKPPRRTP
jgi:hypothetical protein